MTGDSRITIDHSFRLELGLELEGEGVNYCYQCGACVGDCPSARFSDEFNPRKIMQSVLYGMREELIGGTNPIWQCSNCFTCYDRCPQDVKPVEVIMALKNMMARDGVVPDGVEDLAAGVMKTGRSAIVSKMTTKRRVELGLPVLADIPIDQIRRIVGETDPGEGGGA